MNLTSLKYFQVVAQENHITRASQKLNIAQPALSYAISQLEKALGVQLFDRVGRQIILNECGKQLLSHVNVILKNWDIACNEIEQYIRETNDQIKIAVTSILSSQKLIIDFKMIYPGITIKQCVITSDQIISTLTQDKTDFVLSTVDVKDNNIVSNLLKSEDLYILVSKNHRLANKKVVSMDDIVEESFVSLQQGYAFRDLLDSYFHEMGFNHNVVFECFPSQIPELVSINIGIAFISESTLRDNIYPSSVVALPLVSPPKRSFYLLREKTRSLSRSSQLFFDFVIDYYSKNP